MLSFHNMKFEKWCDQLVTSMGQRKKHLSPRQKLNLLCGTKVSWVLTFVIFAVFPAIRKK